MAESRAERETPSVPLPAGGQEQIDRLSALVSAALPAVNFDAGGNADGEAIITVAAADLLPVCRAAAQNPELAFDHLRFISGVDQLEAGIEIVYSLWSYSKRHALFVKTLLPLDARHVDSVTSLWASADWHERETAEMFGVLFDGHPELKHLLLDEDMEIHPLLKAHPLAPIELKQGVTTF
jgi:NADH-quinone oxidoreductase subunit C